MSDLNAPYNGGGAPGLTSYDFTSFAEGLAFWANNSGCSMPADTTITIGNKGNIMTLTYTGCSKDVIGIALQNVQHGWLDLPFAGFDGTKTAIDFFESHPK
jgi:poly(3-hydroxybutyrate) depolymerase